MALGMFILRQYLRNAPRAATAVPAGIGLGVLVFLLWRAGSARKRWLILGCVALVGGVSVPLLALVSSHVFCARFQPGIGIHREGNRLFARAAGFNLSPIEDWKLGQANGLSAHPIDALFPPVPSELLPESESHFFERLSGVPMTFSRDAGGKVTGLTLCYHGKEFPYKKLSDQPPEIPEPPKPHVAIMLESKRLDAYVGRYEVPPTATYPAGIKLTIWREGDQLMAQTRGRNALEGAFEIYPESETNFFSRAFGAQLIFGKNEQGEAKTVMLRDAGPSDCEGKKLK